MLVVGCTELRELSARELALLPDEERRREFGSDSRRRQYQCGRSLLRLLLQEQTGTPAVEHDLTTEQGGKPVCQDGTAISITHTGDRVACVVAQSGLVGIDLECIDLEREVSQIIARFFSTEEQAWIAAGSRQRFFMLWVIKEAFVKAHGQSILGGLEKLRCVVDAARIEARALEGTYRDLGLYGRDGMFLGLATTEVPLTDVEFRHWMPHHDNTEISDEFTMIASTDQSAANTTT